MSRIAIIGAGPAGLIFATALRRAGLDVTLYSERTPKAIRNASTPTGTAFLWAETLGIERDLGMDHWSQDAFLGRGIVLDFCPRTGLKPLSASGQFPNNAAGAAIDQRLKTARWLDDFANAGGRVVIESVTIDGLDAIAATHDLTVLATGKTDLANLVPRDLQRSVYDRPQRHLAMVFARSRSGDTRHWHQTRADFPYVKFDFLADEGEIFFVPYTHKDAGAVTCIVFEARPGSRMDRFADARSPADVLARGLSIMRTLCPWHRAMCDDLVPIDDPHGALTGRFAPTVRQACGETASGHLVMPLGDTAVTFDPIAGQGANHAARHARFLADAVIAHAGNRFDRGWMEAQNHIWWHSDAKFAYALSNLFLEPLSIAAKTVLLEVARNPTFASRFFVPGMTQPKRLFPAMEDFAAARHLVAHWKENRPARAIDLPWWTSGMGWESAIRSRLSPNLYPAPGFARSVLYDLPTAA